MDKKKSGRGLNDEIARLLTELALKELDRLRGVPLNVSGVFASNSPSRKAATPARSPKAPANSRKTAPAPARSPKAPSSRKMSPPASAVAMDAPPAMLMLMLPPVDDESQIVAGMPVMAPLQPEARSDDPREAESAASWAETWTELAPELVVERAPELAAERTPELAAEAWTEQAPELAAEESRLANRRRRREERAERRRERLERARQRREVAASRRAAAPNPAPDERAEPPMFAQPPTDAA